MLQINDLHYSIGDRQLLTGVNWSISKGKRCALIGPNGAGKTTLLRILTGKLIYSSGSIIKPKGYQIGYLPQEEIAIGRGSILQNVLEAQKEILDIEKKIKELYNELNALQSNHDTVLAQLSRLEERFEMLEGYRLESTAKSILSGLGFSVKDYTQDLSNYSGGWRMRVYLARLLIQKPDLLLLDEPTNHLDLPSLEWLEQYLINFNGSMVIVSHDRFFIDRLAHEIYDLDRGKLMFYAGNYHFYEREKEKNEILLKKRWEEQQAEKARQEKFINRFRYKSTKAVQVQSRIKKLEKIEDIDYAPPIERKFNFKLNIEMHSYKDVLKIKDMSFRYDVDWVLQNVNLNIYRGEKIALVGVNGAGKTTITKLIAGQLIPEIGSVKLGERVKMGYYAQHQVDILNLNSSVYDEASSGVAMSILSNVRDILGIFQFTGDDAYKKIEVLSGGEKARVSLAKILLSPSNFLIMDEPTNHLDKISKEALENALTSFEGTALLISHDRYFLDKIVHRVIEIKDHSIREYEGNYSDYLRFRDHTEKFIPNIENKSQTNSSIKKTKEQKRLEAQARQQISKKRNEHIKNIELLEKEIFKLEARQLEIETQMSNVETFKNGELTASLTKEYAQLKINLKELYNNWEQVNVELEELVRQLDEEN